MTPRRSNTAEEPSGGGTRQAIIESGLACMKRFGVRRTTVEEVARAARVSRPTVYAYFKDRQALLDAIHLWNAHLIRIDLEKRFAGARSFADKVEIAVRFAMAQADPLEFGRMDPEWLATMLTSHSDQWISRATTFWLPHVTEAQSVGQIRSDLDATQTARWVGSSLFSMSIRAPANPTRSDIRRAQAEARIYLAEVLAYPEPRSGAQEPSRSVLPAIPS